MIVIVTMAPLLWSLESRRLCDIAVALSKALRRVPHSMTHTNILVDIFDCLKLQIM